ncbi:head maturation protease [Staphylococcus phage S-CoN_Ph11]|jgi:phage prohead protease, HK97 family|uniref:Assembly protease n=2 Tax=Sextaecvirus TaxID=1922243 RepID=A0A060AB24_9CAUD|nr:head maturation protease [Staphylococcus phage 6ec]MDU6246549.1 HK97 family phage prohead protease [Staphylococcus lugdunensis]MDU6254537.1 HK97 family phage prohead protease [Staphylococcus warneri]WNM51519.1 head maturation protease [Staphylococcus phage S-CoN_Ph1]WNM51593.1 head maturation protease [Staphylococcus phage S-CoN_Ph2]WNM51755.1 head maturation protease [Staphylococcus phage S-CoN_Ph3]WNM52005.1 head maturation protease [Staphylococcus phage S-CoN_Ph4]WNM52185.1 head matura
MAKVEFRMHDAKMTSEGDMIVAGYVNQTEQFSQELGLAKRFKEKISKGAFQRAISKSDRDIDFLAEHDSSVVLASTKNGTLDLKEDDKGLYMEARVINTSAGRDWYEMISSGLITNMSFGFQSINDEWRSVGENLFERTINDLELFEVSAVRNPAYAQSSISNRGLDTSDEDIVPEDIEEENVMEQRTADQLLTAISELTNEVRELRGTLGTDKDGKTVNVQKDNYAAGQQTSAQAESDSDHKRIKADEENGKYAGDKEIDGKGSYNHDKKVPAGKDDGTVENEPESQSGKTAYYDGSLPEDIPGEQNGEDGKQGRVQEDKDTSSSQTGSQDDTSSSSTSEKQDDKTQSDSTSTSQGEGRSISFAEAQRRIEELRGGK